MKIIGYRAFAATGMQGAGGGTLRGTIRATPEEALADLPDLLSRCYQNDCDGCVEVVFE